MLTAYFTLKTMRSQQDELFNPKYKTNPHLESLKPFGLDSIFVKNDTM